MELLFKRKAEVCGEPFPGRRIWGFLKALDYTSLENMKCPLLVFVEQQDV